MSLPDPNRMPCISVDRPCDIHRIECEVRGLKEVPEAAKCRYWETGCTEECCRRANRNREVCNLEYWENRRYGESLWPIP